MPLTTKYGTLSDWALKRYMTPVRLLLLSGTCRCDFHVSHSFSSYLLSCAARLMLAFSCQISTFRAFFLRMWRYLES